MSEALDSGLQPERTLLAWRRTALAIAVIGAAGIRFGTSTVAPVATALGLVCIALAAASYVVAARRYAAAQREIASESPLTRGGLAHLLLAASVVVLGSLGLAGLFL